MVGIISVPGSVSEWLCSTMGQVFQSFQPEVKIVSGHSCYVVNTLHFRRGTKLSSLSIFRWASSSVLEQEIYSDLL